MSTAGFKTFKLLPSSECSSNIDLLFESNYSVHYFTKDIQQHCNLIYNNKHIDDNVKIDKVYCDFVNKQVKYFYVDIPVDIIVKYPSIFKIGNKIMFDTIIEKYVDDNNKNKIKFDSVNIIVESKYDNKHNQNSIKISQEDLDDEEEWEE